MWCMFFYANFRCIPAQGLYDQNLGLSCMYVVGITHSLSKSAKTVTIDHDLPNR